MGLGDWSGSGDSGLAGVSGVLGKREGGGPSMFPEKYEKRSRMNKEAMEYYAAALCGLMALFVLLHLSRVLARKSGLNKATIFAPFHYVSRFAPASLGSKARSGI